MDQVFPSITKSIGPSLSIARNLGIRDFGENEQTLSLSLSSTSATDGDNITFTFSGPAGTHLRKDGVWVYTGDTSPCVIRVGPLDAGSYTACYWNGATLVESTPVSLTVSTNNTLSETFTSGVSAGWTSTSGTPTVSGGKLSIDAATLTKSISDNNCRVKLTIDVSALTSGYVTIARLQGVEYPICNIEVFESSGTKYIRYAPNVNGFYSGGDYEFGYNPVNTYYQQIVASTITVELRWDMATKSVWIYSDDKLSVVVKNSSDFLSFTPTAATQFSIGNLNGTFGGTITIDDVYVKQGNAAIQAFSAKSRLAAFHVFGQSNAIGAATGSYSGVTDAIDSAISGVVEGGSYSGGVMLPTTPNSTASVFGFIQGIDLPAGFAAFIQNGGVGSTSFTTPSGSNNWNATDGLYRTRMKDASQMIDQIGEHVAHIAILFHGFEGDTAAYTQSTWNAELADFLDELRTSIGDTSCPLVIGGFSPAFLTGGENETAGYVAMNSWNSNFVASVDTVLGAFGSSTSPTALTYQSGSPQYVHFDAAGYRNLGARMASAFLDANKRAKPN